MDTQHTVQVQVYSGHSYAQRPLSFEWEGSRREVEAIEAEWHTPQGKAFRVRTASGWHFRLVYRTDLDCWQIEV